MFIRTYKNLPATGRLALGAGILAWGGIGLYLSDRAEEKFGFTPSPEEKAALERVMPSITVVDRYPEKK